MAAGVNLARASIAVLDQPLAPQVLYGNYEAPRCAIAPLFWPLFAALIRRQPGRLTPRFRQGYWQRDHP